MTTKDLGALVAASCGLLYPVLLFVGDDVIARGDEIASDAGTPREVLAAIAEKDTSTFFIGRSLGMLSVICLFVFAAYIAARLRDLRGESSLLPSLALGAGAMAAVLQLGSSVFQLSLVEHGGKGVNPELAVLLLDLGLGFLLAMLPLAVLLFTVAAAGVRGELVGRAVAWTAAVLSAGLVAGFVLFVNDVTIGFLPMPLTWLWFVAASISCLRRTGTPRTAPRQPALAR